MFDQKKLITMNFPAEPQRSEYHQPGVQPRVSGM